MSGLPKLDRIDINIPVQLQKDGAIGNLLRPRAWPLKIRDIHRVGLIAFSQSLPYKNFDNNISKILANVVDAFSSKKLLPGWAWSAEEKQWR